MDTLASQPLVARHHPHGAAVAAWLRPEASGAMHSSAVSRAGLERRRWQDNRRVQAATPASSALSSAAVMRVDESWGMWVPQGTVSNTRRRSIGVPYTRACCVSQPVALSVKAEDSAPGVEAGSVSVVLLSGGVGKRMGASMPKQYLPLRGQPIAVYSFLTFAGMEEVGEIVVVCDPSYESVFLEAQARSSLPLSALKFARPGKERQDSVFSGLQQIRGPAALVAVHDSARPLVSVAETRKVLADAIQHGAAVLGVPSKATVKESDGNGFVARTLDRSLLWEMQTPQVMRPQLLRDGFSLVQEKGLEVTDDVSIVEHLGHPVKITQGFYTNIKVTTPDDMLVAEKLLASEEAAAKAQLSASAA